MDTIAIATLLATWAATSDGVSIALESLAVLWIAGAGREHGNMLALPLIEGTPAALEPSADDPRTHELRRRGSILAMLGGLELTRGNLDRARSAEIEARSIFQRMGDRRWEGLSLWYLALVAAAEHSHREAASAYRESLLAFLDAGEPSLVYKPLLGLASIAVQHEQPEIAAQLLGSADAQRRRSGDRLLPFDLAAERQAETLSRGALGDAVFAAWRARGQDHDAPVWTSLADDVILVAKKRSLRPPRASAGNGDALTVREQDVLRLVVEGRSNPEIADALCVGVGTAKTHVAHILAKLGVSTRAAAASHAVRMGLI